MIFDKNIEILKKETNYKVMRNCGRPCSKGQHEIVNINKTCKSWFLFRYNIPIIFIALRFEKSSQKFAKCKISFFAFVDLKIEIQIN